MEHVKSERAQRKAILRARHAAERSRVWARAKPALIGGAVLWAAFHVLSSNSESDIRGEAVTISQRIVQQTGKPRAVADAAKGLNRWNMHKNVGQDVYRLTSVLSKAAMADQRVTQDEIASVRCEVLRRQPAEQSGATPKIRLVQFSMLKHADAGWELAALPDKQPDPELCADVLARF